MEPQFWLLKWQNSETGFHEDDVNPNLTSHFSKLGLPLGSHIFVPLCGKTLDISWLLAEGHTVTGAELSETAVNALFEQLDLEPEIKELGALKVFRHDKITIYCGDIFELTSCHLGKVDGVYDRAALVALPFEMRRRYVHHLMEITARAPQLLVTFDYDQTTMNGPPFAIINSEVEQHYRSQYDLTLLSAKPLKLKDKTDAIENVWRLLPLE